MNTRQGYSVCKDEYIQKIPSHFDVTAESQHDITQPWLRDITVFFAPVPAPLCARFLSLWLSSNSQFVESRLIPNLYSSSQKKCLPCAPRGVFFFLWSDSVDSLPQVLAIHHHRKGFSVLWLRGTLPTRCAHTILLFLDTHFAQGSALYPLCSSVSLSKVPTCTVLWDGWISFYWTHGLFSFKWSGINVNLPTDNPDLWYTFLLKADVSEYVKDCEFFWVGPKNNHQWNPMYLSHI